MRRGKQRRRRWPLALGAVVFLALMTPSAVLVYGAARGLDAGAALQPQSERAASSPEPSPSPQPSPSPTPSPTPTPSSTPAIRLVPTAKAIDRAVAYLRSRNPAAGIAVVDTHGELHGYRADVAFPSASVVKAMLLVQYLRTHRTIAPAMRTALTAMIERSDNEAAALVSASVGAAGLRRLARTAGMTRFSPSPYLLVSRITAADQARFFYAMDGYIPARHRTFARSLLSHIVKGAWGVVEVARPAWRVYCKSGWMGKGDLPYTLVNQVARLERRKLRWSVAVLSDHNQPWPYGVETIRGVTRLLLGRD